jgi:hypothetical protein
MRITASLILLSLLSLSCGKNDKPSDAPSVSPFKPETPKRTVAPIVSLKDEALKSPEFLKMENTSFISLKDFYTELQASKSILENIQQFDTVQEIVNIKLANCNLSYTEQYTVIDFTQSVVDFFYKKIPISIDQKCPESLKFTISNQKHRYDFEAKYSLQKFIEKQFSINAKTAQASKIVIFKGEHFENPGEFTYFIYQRKASYPYLNKSYREVLFAPQLPMTASVMYQKEYSIDNKDVVYQKITRQFWRPSGVKNLKNIDLDNLGFFDYSKTSN